MGSAQPCGHGTSGELLARATN